MPKQVDRLPLVAKLAIFAAREIRLVLLSGRLAALTLTAALAELLAPRGYRLWIVVGDWRQPSAIFRRLQE